MNRDTPSHDPAQVLIVDDERHLARLYRKWVPDSWEAAVATDAEAGMETLTDETDIVVLDRRMPGESGDALLRRLRDAGYDCQVVMVTAVEPDFDIIEMGIDEYLVKPVDPETFERTLFRLADRLTYDEHLREYYALVSKKAVLEATKSPAELSGSAEYQELVDDIERTRRDVDEMLDDISRREGYAGLFRGLFDPDAVASR